MRFHCNKCNQDFTTLSEDKGKKFAFRHFMLDQMSCPNCRATNVAHVAKKALPKNRMRWQPKRRSMDTDDYLPPSIVLHELCQKRLSGNPLSIDGMKVNCTGCPEQFNCWTGNVDDGSIKASDYTKGIQDKADKDRAIAVEEAKEKIAKEKKLELQKQIKGVRDSFGKIGFRYNFVNGNLYARWKGTAWKLDKVDEQAIINMTWDTPNTEIIKKSLTGILPLSGAKLVLLYEKKLLK